MSPPSTSGGAELAGGETPVKPDHEATCLVTIAGVACSLARSGRHSPPLAVRTFDMRVPSWVSEFFEWRWAPCVGLTAGSLGFVALALLLIPARFGDAPPVADRPSTFDGSRPRQAMYSAALASNLIETETERAPEREHARRASPQPSQEARAAVARGFSPVIERPEPPPQPAPAATVEPPAPGSAIDNQPAPAVEARTE